MTIKQITRKLALAATLLAPLASPAKPPNILFFFVDDMGWQDTSVPFAEKRTKLNRDYQTPNMERLAEKSTVFTNAYACAICSPTRVSLMTGQNAARHRVTNWTLHQNKSPGGLHDPFLKSGPWNINGLQPVGAKVRNTVEARTVADYLRELGYKTIHVGKAHFGANETPGEDPLNLGFDVNIGGHCAGGPGSYYGKNNFSAAFRKGARIWDVPGLEKYHGQDIHLNDALTLEAIDAVKTAAQTDRKPFYLYMSHYAVHAPFERDPRFMDDFPRRKDFRGHKTVYASMLKSMDKSLGDLMDAIEELGVADNTIIVFMSDNGSPKQNPRNLPLRGHKITPYEGGTRVPMMVHRPGDRRSVRTDTPVIIEDIFPTFLEWGGMRNLNIPENDGVSFTEILDDPETDRSARPLFWHYPNFYDQPPYSSVRLGDLKLIYWHRDQSFELYDLKKDIGEEKNLAEQRPDDVMRLAKVLADHLRETKALIPISKKTDKPIPLPDEAAEAL